MDFSLSFLSKIAKKYPALARWLEGIIYWSGISLATWVLLAIAQYTQDGNFENLKTAITWAGIAFIVAVIESWVSALQKYKRNKKQE